jgi:hypothetical protein
MPKAISPLTIHKIKSIFWSVEVPFCSPVNPIA